MTVTVTATQGTNTIVGNDPRQIVTEALTILDGGSKAGRVPELWDGRAAERIVNVLVEALGAEQGQTYGKKNGETSSD